MVKSGVLWIFMDVLVGGDSRVASGCNRWWNIEFKKVMILGS